MMGTQSTVMVVTAAVMLSMAGNVMDHRRLAHHPAVMALEEAMKPVMMGMVMVMTVAVAIVRLRVDGFVWGSRHRVHQCVGMV